MRVARATKQQQNGLFIRDVIAKGTYSPFVKSFQQILRKIILLNVVDRRVYI